jgi:hypothetical protein
MVQTAGRVTPAFAKRERESMTFSMSKQITSPVPLSAPASPIIPEPGAPPEVRDSFARHVNGLGKHERYDSLKPILCEAALNGDVSTIETFNPLLDHRDGRLLHDVLETAAAKGHAEIVSIILKRHSLMLPDISKAMELVLENYDKSNPSYRKTFEGLFVRFADWFQVSLKWGQGLPYRDKMQRLLARVSGVDTDLAIWCLQQFVFPEFM